MKIFKTLNKMGYNSLINPHLGINLERGWNLNKVTGTNGIARFGDLPSAAVSYTDATKCPTKAEIQSSVKSTHKVTISGSYANNQLVKYTDITFTVAQTGKVTWVIASTKGWDASIYFGIGSNYVNTVNVPDKHLAATVNPGYYKSQGSGSIAGSAVSTTSVVNALGYSCPVSPPSSVSLNYTIKNNNSTIASGSASIVYSSYISTTQLTKSIATFTGIAANQLNLTVNLTFS